LLVKFAVGVTTFTAYTATLRLASSITTAMLTPARFEEITHALEHLAERKSWQLNHRGNRVKVVRRYSYSYDVYHNGHWVNTETDWMQAFELTKALLEAK
jgi:hypothetical protein